MRATPCVPRRGHTGLIIGQDYGSILNYTSKVVENSKPFGLMTYTALRNENGDLPGLESPIDYGSGTEWAVGLSNRYPGSAIQLGLWIVNVVEQISSGDLDAQIDLLISTVNASDSDYYIRIGYEFDSESNNYDTEAYKAAFKYIVSRFRAARVENAVFVWHASGFKPRNKLSVQAWFPGATFVDWCGVSLFQQPYDCQSADVCRMEYPSQFAEFCGKNGIPLMIAESAPFGGIVNELEVPRASNEAGFKGSSWSKWFTPVLAFIEKYDVRIWSYINCNWDSQPMWAKEHSRGESWGDTRIEEYSDVLDRWKLEVLKADRYILSYDTVLADDVCQDMIDTRPAGSDLMDILRSMGVVLLSMFVPFLYLFCVLAAIAIGFWVYDKYFLHRSGYQYIH